MSIEGTFRKQLLRAAIPFQHFIDAIGKPDPLITDEQYLAIKPKLQNGSVLLAHDEWQATNLFIPGFWKHAAIYADGYVHEAVGSGVRKVLAERWLLQKDNVFVCHAAFPVDTVKISWFLEQQNGKPYNFLFDTESLNFQLTDQKAWYCAELVYGALKYASDPFQFNLQLQVIMDDLTIPPQGLRDQVGQGLVLDYMAINSTKQPV
jgi:hypothetical protein